MFKSFTLGRRQTQRKSNWQHLKELLFTYDKQPVYIDQVLPLEGTKLDANIVKMYNHLFADITSGQAFKNRDFLTHAYGLSKEDIIMYHNASAKIVESMFKVSLSAPKGELITKYSKNAQGEKVVVQNVKRNVTSDAMYNITKSCINPEKKADDVCNVLSGEFETTEKASQFIELIKSCAISFLFIKLLVVYSKACTHESATDIASCTTQSHELNKINPVLLCSPSIELLIAMTKTRIVRNWVTGLMISMKSIFDVIMQEEIDETWNDELERLLQQISGLADLLSTGPIYTESAIEGQVRVELIGKNRVPIAGVMNERFFPTNLVNLLTGSDPSPDEIQQFFEKVQEKPNPTDILNCKKPNPLIEKSDLKATADAEATYNLYNWSDYLKLYHTKPNLKSFARMQPEASRTTRASERLAKQSNLSGGKRRRRQTRRKPRHAKRRLHKTHRR